MSHLNYCEPLNSLPAHIGKDLLSRINWFYYRKVFTQLFNNTIIDNVTQTKDI
jgi:hypothetical protein